MNKERKHSLRVIPLQEHTAAMNMAIDEALTEFVGEKESPPTLRLYTWKPSAISIGYFQSLEGEVDVQACKEKGVDIVRRSTGGGAVFHDAELTYSIILPNDIVPKDILASYAFLCTAITKTGEALGVQATFAPINDILIENKKVSGNAQTRKHNAVLQHGTILLKVDVDMMFSLLKVPDEKMKGKLITQIKERVTSLEKELQRTVSPEEVAKLVAEQFARLLEMPTMQGALTPQEQKRAEDLKKTKYLKDDWTGMK